MSQFNLKEFHKKYGPGLHQQPTLQEEPENPTLMAVDESPSEGASAETHCGLLLEIRDADHNGS